MTTPTTPAIHIVIPIEAAPQLRVEAGTFEEEKALEAWLRTHPRLGLLIEDFHAIAEEMTA